MYLGFNFFWVIYIGTIWCISNHTSSWLLRTRWTYGCFDQEVKWKFTWNVFISGGEWSFTILGKICVPMICLPPLSLMPPSQSSAHLAGNCSRQSCQPPLCSWTRILLWPHLGRSAGSDTADSSLLEALFSLGFQETTHHAVLVWPHLWPPVQSPLPPSLLSSL